MLDILEYPCYYMQAIEIAHAPVAQLDRVTDYESVGQGVESLPAYQIGYLRVSDLFLFSGSKNPFPVGRAALPPPTSHNDRPFIIEGPAQNHHVIARAVRPVAISRYLLPTEPTSGRLPRRALPSSQ